MADRSRMDREGCTTAPTPLPATCSPTITGTLAPTTFDCEALRPFCDPFPGDEAYNCFQYFTAYGPCYFRPTLSPTRSPPTKPPTMSPTTYTPTLSPPTPQPAPFPPLRYPPPPLPPPPLSPLATASPTTTPPPPPQEQLGNPVPPPSVIPPAAATNLSLSLFDITPAIQTAWDANDTSIWTAIPPGQHTHSAAIAYNETIGVKISVSDEAGVMDHTFFSALLVLQFSPRSKPLPPSSVGTLEPIVHYDIIPDLCGVTPSNADDVRMIRLFDDRARTDMYLDYQTTQWLRVTAELLDVEVRQRYDSFAVLLPQELMREFSGWNARVCSLAAYDNAPPFNELGAEVQVRTRVSAVPLRQVVAAAGDVVPACMRAECAGAGTAVVADGAVS